MSEYEKTDHVGVFHVIKSVEPVPSGHLHLVSSIPGVRISSYHHSMEDAREQVGRNSCFLSGKAEELGVNGGEGH